jgi:hypothetical protein
MTSQAPPARQMKGQTMTTPGTNWFAVRLRRARPASQEGGLVAAALYPVAGQAATTAGALRAAADLIERSAATGLSVTCFDGFIQILVTEHCGDAPARAAVVARLAGCFGSVAVQQDGHRDRSSCITASGNAGGLHVEIFTPLTVQKAGTGPGGEVLLAAAPDGRAVRVVPPHDLPAGHRWLTDLDPSPAPTASPAAPGRRRSRTPGRGRQARA